MRDVGCHVFREQFVTYAWLTAQHGANYASPSVLTDFVPLKCYHLRGIAGTKFVRVRGSLNRRRAKFTTFLKFYDRIMHLMQNLMPHLRSVNKLFQPSPLQKIRFGRFGQAVSGGSEVRAVRSSWLRHCFISTRRARHCNDATIRVQWSD